ncbi:hypothetical protein MTR67_011840, partial [Solanum verrucosum]
PTSPTDIRSFLSLAGYYRRFVEGFSSIVSPLKKLTQKKVKFWWSDDCEKSFAELKTRLTTIPILTLPEGLDCYVINCDASSVSLGCVDAVSKANVVEDDLSRLSMGSVAHIEEERKELARDVHRLARLGVRCMSISDGGVIVQNGAKSSLVAEVKEKQDSDPILFQLKCVVHQQRVAVFFQGGDSVLRYQGRLCVPKMVFWLNGMERDIANFVAKCPNFQQVMVEHQKQLGMTQEFNIPTWKCEVINKDFITGLPRTRRQHDSIWVVVDRVTKSACFLAIKTTNSVEDNAKIYINEIVRLHGVPLSIIQIEVLNLPLISGSHFRKVLVLKSTLAKHFIHRRKVRQSVPFIS